MIQTTIGIDGMMCEMCEAHINDAIRNAFSVKKVTSSRTRGEAIILSETPPNAEKLKQIITSAGYTFVSASSENAEKKSFLSGLLKL
jgi:copper chaperone CopZ